MLALLAIHLLKPLVSAKDMGRLHGVCLGVLAVNVIFLGIYFPVHTLVVHAMFVISPMVVCGKIFLLFLIGLLMLLSWGQHQKSASRCFECPLFLLCSAIGGMFVLSSGDFLLLFMGLELQSLPLFVLAASKKHQAHSGEAALKYFVLGALSTCLFLFGVSLVYGATGTVSFFALEAIITPSFVPSLPLYAGIMFVLASFGFKLAAVPFHMWAPDVYEGTPSFVTTCLATFSKVTVFLAIFYLLYSPFANLLAVWQPLVMASAVLSMVVGAWGALFQKCFKRMLAYSAIGHMGYMLAGLSLHTKDGACASFSYMVFYTILTMGSMGLLLFIKKTHTAPSLQTLPPSPSPQGLPIKALSGLFYRCPWAGGLISILMLSLAGIPPLGGFFTKLFLLQTMVQQGNFYLVFVALVASVVSCFYYLHVVATMYTKDPQAHTVGVDLPLFLKPVFMGIGVFSVGFSFCMPLLMKAFGTFL